MFRYRLKSTAKCSLRHNVSHICKHPARSGQLCQRGMNIPKNCPLRDEDMLVGVGEVSP